MKNTHGCSSTISTEVHAIDLHAEARNGTEKKLQIHTQRENSATQAHTHVGEVRPTYTHVDGSTVAHVMGVPHRPMSRRLSHTATPPPSPNNCDASTSDVQTQNSVSIMHTFEYSTFTTLIYIKMFLFCINICYDDVSQF